MGSLSAFHWIIIGVVVLVIVKAVRDNTSSGMVKANGRLICPSCGTRGEPKLVTRGSIWIEIVLWICLLIPGMVYSIWRLTTRHGVCPACQQPGMIPVGSPNGERLVRQFETR